MSDAGRSSTVLGRGAGLPGLDIGLLSDLWSVVYLDA